MSELHGLVTPGRSEQPEDQLIREATACLHRFTAAFNACDSRAIDAELHFPHQMYAASQMLTWTQAGQHPEGFFADLMATGWVRTAYEWILPVLVSRDKVHFVVEYSRRSATDAVLSLHSNLWIVIYLQGRWGIVLRSY